MSISRLWWLIWFSNSFCFRYLCFKARYNIKMFDSLYIICSFSLLLSTDPKKPSFTLRPKSGHLIFDGNYENHQTQLVKCKIKSIAKCLFSCINCIQKIIDSSPSRNSSLVFFCLTIYLRCNKISLDSHYRSMLPNV